MRIRPIKNVFAYDDIVDGISLRLREVVEDPSCKPEIQYKEVKIKRNE